MLELRVLSVSLHSCIILSYYHVPMRVLSTPCCVQLYVMYALSVQLAATCFLEDVFD